MVIFLDTICVRGFLLAIYHPVSAPVFNGETSLDYFKDKETFLYPPASEASREVANFN
jgi:hypothetical protein